VLVVLAPPIARPADPSLVLVALVTMVLTHGAGARC
jgi:hypothetical protein